MGVKTLVWGPGAWLYIHACAQALDAADDPSLATAFWSMVTAVLPCKPCRASTAKILSGLVEPSNQRLAYVLHQEVTLKLFRQELARGPVRDVLEARVGRQPRFEDVVYLVPDTCRFVHVLTDFFYSVVCDYDDSRADAVASLLPLTATVFRHTAFGVALQQALAHTPVPGWTSLHHRVHYVHQLHTHLCFFLRRPPPLPQKERFAWCLETLVGGRAF